MKLRKYKWILVFFILWLPLQGATAAILSVCEQEDFSLQTMMIADNHHHDACQEQVDTIDHVLASLPCDNDSSCDAYNNTLILSGYSAPLPPNDTSAITLFYPGFTSFVPEQPQRPPLTISL